LVSALAGMLRPGTVRTGVDVDSYERDGAAVRVKTGDGGVVDAQGLVGADGIGSAVARTMVGPLQYNYSGYTAWRGVAHGVPDPSGPGIWAYLVRGHEVGWLPLRDDRTYWFATAWLPEGHSFPDGDPSYLNAEFGAWPEPIPSLLRSTPADQLVRNDIVDRAALDHFSDGPVALLGDAAHPMRPHLGQGGCQAIEDAAALAGWLSAASDPAAAFARYDELRRRRAARIVSVSKRSGLTRPMSLTTRSVDRVSSLLPSLPIGPLVRGLAPIAGYRAGLKAVAARR